jgi:CxxC-x17-CxxC domain-containing protein
MHQGNWKCSSCGGAITELPFVPRSESGLTCRACYAKQKGGSSQSSAPAPEMNTASAPVPYDIPDDAGLAGDPGPTDDGLGAVPVSAEKPRFSGDWKCAGCDSAITSLPFQPRDTSNLKCIDCFKRSKA